MYLVELMADEGQLSDQGSHFRSNIWDHFVDLSSCRCPGCSGGISELMARLMRGNSSGFFEVESPGSATHWDCGLGQVTALPEFSPHLQSGAGDIYMVGLL